MNSHPLAAIFGHAEEESTNHALGIEAQAENLRAAWEHYSTEKHFVPGQFVRCREGMSIFRDDPVVCMFVRKLDESSKNDLAIMRDAIKRNQWNKVDCMIARVHNTGTWFTLPFDSDILEEVIEQ
jgi:hypothetical protein